MIIVCSCPELDFEIVCLMLSCFTAQVHTRHKHRRSC